MNLPQELADHLAKSQANRPPEIKQVMGKATEDLVKSGITDQSLNTGDTAPNFSLPNATGQTVAISDLLANGPVVISFYRGQWCPYCNLELRALQEALPEIQSLGAKLAAISPQTPDNSLSTTEKNELTFEVLSDVGNQVARQFGLVFSLPEELRPIYQGFGIDLPAHNGDKTFELPIPATYVIKSDGAIAHAFVDPDYTKRMDPADIVAALRSL
ncbi:MAG: peroxiredoxin-like family protein [Leptolyngbyaceae cyanobacterium MO_188.B28]|nr:peroxiredoxin-like family protein [Leptolyngbyaceae cyanobacterium MO_188.B28]